MSAVNLDQLNEYINNLEDDENGLKQIYIDAAEQMIVDYLGYDFNEKDYEETFEATDDGYIQLSAFPVSELTSVEIGGVDIDVADFTISKNLLYYTNGIFSESTAVEYTAGNASVPGIIKLVELQIAGLLYAEANGNIGITSKSFDQGNSRTFIKTTNFAPYLSKLDSLRLRRL